MRNGPNVAGGGMALNPHQQMIYEAFNSEIYVQNRMDVQHTPLYDSVTLAAAGTVSDLTTALFTNVGPASGKTQALTNMTQGNKLPAPQAFSMFGVRFRWNETILYLDLETILNQFALVFKLGDKPYQQAPLWYFSAGGGIWAATTRTDESIYVNGMPGRDSMHRLAIPIVIENQATFTAYLVGTAYTLATAQNGGTGFFFQCLLDGLYARGVQ